MLLLLSVLAYSLAYALLFSVLAYSLAYAFSCVQTVTYSRLWLVVDAHVEQHDVWERMRHYIGAVLC
jgi:hypothetical protein